MTAANSKYYTKHNYSSCQNIL